MSDYIIGSPFKVSHRHFRRDDLYLPTNNYNSIMVASLQDQTPVYKHWQLGNYNSVCSCCYLNITHSEAKHQESI